MSSPYPACVGLSPAGPVLGLGWSIRATCLLPSAAALLLETFAGAGLWDVLSACFLRRKASKKDVVGSIRNPAGIVYL